MAEMNEYSPNDASLFLSRIQFPVPEDQIREVFPCFFPDRRVLHVNGPFLGHEPHDERVLKVRPTSYATKEEVRKLTLLLASDRYGGGLKGRAGIHIHEIGPSKYTVIDMPYLGVDLHKLAMKLDMIDLGYEEPDPNGFVGFTDRELMKILKILRTSHMEFAEKTGIIHGDLIQNGAANNIVYDAKRKRLLFVDAEAMTDTTEESIARFTDQMAQLEQWMCKNVLKI
jgi:hypothetical protein